MREPKVKNKYNLKPKDIQKATILDFERLKQPPFWRNNVIGAWCLSGGAGKGFYGHIDSYWIGFYDEDAKAYVGKIRLNCSSYEDMCRYDFKEFFDYREIENEFDLELQEILLDKINWLIDEKIIEINL